MKGQCLKPTRLAARLLLAVTAGCLLLTACSKSDSTSSGSQDNVGPTPTPTPTNYSLVVSKRGVGTVRSSSNAIDCGSTCSVNVPITTPATTVTLSASASSGYAFAGWSGSGISCPGTGTCTVSMNENRNVLATFTNDTTQILFDEHFDNFGTDLTYSFDGWLFGDSTQSWTRQHLATGGVNDGPAFLATSTFDSSIQAGGTSYYFRKDFTGDLADYSRDFWIRQCMKYSNGYLDARVRGPVGAKINYFVGPGGGFMAYRPLSENTFHPGERVVGQSSLVRADIFSPDPASTRVTNISGTFQNGETIVGQTSRATATFLSFAPEERTIAFNHFWHPGSAPLFRADEYEELVWYDITTDAFFGSNNPVNQVQHTNWLLLQEHYNEWMCLETHIDLDQAPWVIEIYVTTAPGAATLAAGTTGLDDNGRRQFNDYLYIRYSNPVAPAVEAGFGIGFNQYGAYGMTFLGDEIYFDEMTISTGKLGHPFH